ncbi:hypothetical protein [Streptomyces orinoci]|uniref:Proteinase inhibitor I42 chagasin domain-containing protein n=1 Tax=Streptomyces orinoci TaxID=67339 RepID=A0ABV3JVG9_STRON|nr:hypothetical protein [Streptomyces orinoci]
MRVKALAVPFALGMALTGVALSAPASFADTSAATVTLTETDNGTAVSVHTGDVIKVQLTGSRGNGLTWTWSTPTASSTDVLTQTDSASLADGSVTATFQANSNGTTVITSTKGCVPDPGHFCSHLMQQWNATVTVN